MIERLVPFLDLVLLYLLTVTLATLVGKGLLVLRRRQMDDISDFGSSTTFLMLIGVVLMPLLWMISAVLHQAENDQVAIACAVGHVTRDLGREGLNLLVVAFGGLLSLLIVEIIRHRAESEKDRRLSPSTPQAKRLRTLVNAHPLLKPIADRIIPVTRPSIQLCTRAYLRPRIEVGVSVLDSLSDDCIIAALLHEMEHWRGRDPFRYLVIRACALLNPASFILKHESSRWMKAREVACDRFAVLAGANPFSLAEALVSVARSNTRIPTRSVGINSAGFSWLQVRVRLLLNYAKKPPREHPPRDPRLLLAMIAIPVILPHIIGTWPLVKLHHGVESALRWSGLL